MAQGFAGAVEIVGFQPHCPAAAVEPQPQGVVPFRHGHHRAVAVAVVLRSQLQQRAQPVGVGCSVADVPVILQPGGAQFGDHAFVECLEDILVDQGLGGVHALDHAAGREEDRRTHRPVHRYLAPYMQRAANCAVAAHGQLSLQPGRPGHCQILAQRRRTADSQLARHIQITLQGIVLAIQFALAQIDHFCGQGIPVRTADRVARFLVRDIRRQARNVSHRIPPRR